MGRKKDIARKVCGIIMPISTMKVGELTYSDEYWKGVLAFLYDAIKSAGFEPMVAWENDKSDVIHAKIVQNIDSHDVMIAVLVGNNPNVCLECGMRLWSQKPLLILVSDKAPKIPFDISPVNCLEFPEDCHYEKLKRLKSKIKDSLKRISAAGYPSILSHFASVKLSDETPSVKKEDIERFMNETKDSIRKLQSQVETIKSLSQSYDKPLIHFDAPYSKSIQETYLKTLKDLNTRFTLDNYIRRKDFLPKAGVEIGPTGPSSHE